MVYKNDHGSLHGSAQKIHVVVVSHMNSARLTPSPLLQDGGAPPRVHAEISLRWFHRTPRAPRAGKYFRRRQENLYLGPVWVFKRKRPKAEQKTERRKVADP